MRRMVLAGLFALAACTNSQDSTVPSPSPTASPTVSPTANTINAAALNSDVTELRFEVSLLFFFNRETCKEWREEGRIEEWRDRLYAYDDAELRVRVDDVLSALQLLLGACIGGRAGPELQSDLQSHFEESFDEFRIRVEELKGPS